MRAVRRRGFSIIELLVVIGIIAVLMSILFPMAERMRHRAYIDSCASNLRQIGQALTIYATDNGGAYPRTSYDPERAESPGWTAGNDKANKDPFSGAHVPNDVTAAIYLLMRNEGLPAKLFICPYNDVNVYAVDPADPYNQGNFTDYNKNLGYSFANMYPSSAAAAKGYKWGGKFSTDFVIAADLNPGPGSTAPFDRLTAVTPTSPSSVREKGNSNNHESEGQNVLYADGHVVYSNTCLCGVNQDNIYTNRGGQVSGSPVDKDDSMLIPFETTP